MAERRYWAIRMDTENRALLLDELQQGRLRQGWGWHASQDLTRITLREQAGKTLTDEERAARPARRMASDDGVQIGDLVVVPRFPEEGELLIAEVTGPYMFDRLELHGGQDVNELGKDYGHILPVRLPPGFNVPRDTSLLTAPLRRSLTCRSRMWSLDDHGAALDDVWKLVVVGPIGRGHERKRAVALQTVIARARAVVHDTLDAALELELRKSFGAAELEYVCVEMFRQLYPGAEVRHTGGPNEKGADVVVTWTDPDGLDDGLRWTLVVQVKCWTGIAQDVHSLEQLRLAVKSYDADAPVRAARLYTLCDEEAPEFAAHRRRLAEELGVPVTFVGRRAFIRQLRELALAGALDDL